MAARIRLQRAGRKKRAFFHIVVADARANRDGKAIEHLGYYDPIQKELTLQIDADRALYWLKQGARPSETAKSLLERAGVWKQFAAAESAAPSAVSDQQSAISDQP